MRGLSLLEVVLSASLIGLIFIFLLNIFPASMLGVRQAEHRLAAQAQAQRLLDEASARGFDRLGVNGDYTASNPGPFAGIIDDQKSEDGVVLSSRVVVSDVNPIPRNRLARVRVLVTWTERERPQVVTREIQVSALRR